MIQSTISLMNLTCLSCSGSLSRRKFSASVIISPSSSLERIASSSALLSMPKASRKLMEAFVNRESGNFFSPALRFKMPLGFPIVDFIIIHSTRPAPRLQDVLSCMLRATKLVAYFIAQKFLLVAFLQYALRIACYHSNGCGTINERVASIVTPHQNDDERP